MNTEWTLKYFVATALVTQALFAQAQETDEFNFLDHAAVSGERTISSQKSVLWTLPFETTQFIPAHPTSAMSNAMAAQQAGRYLDAIVMLEEAKNDSALPNLQLLRAQLDAFR